MRSRLAALAVAILSFGWVAPTHAASPSPAIAPPPELPPEVLVVAALRSLTDLEQAVQRFAPRLAPAIAKAGKFTADLDPAAPVRVALIDPKRFGWYPAVIMRLRPESSLANEVAAKGHLGIGSIAFDALGRDVVMTSRPDLFAAHRATFEALAGWVPAAPVVVDFCVQKARGLYRAELDAIVQMASAMGRGAGDIGDMRLVLEGLDRLLLAIDPAGDRPRVAVTVAAVPDSELGRDFAKMPVKVDLRRLLDEVPRDAWFVMAGDGGRPDVERMLADLLETFDALSFGVVQSGTWSSEALASVRRPLELLAKSYRGADVMWMRDTELPLTIEGFAESTNAPALHDALVGIAEAAVKQTRDLMIAAAAGAGVEVDPELARLTPQEFLVMLADTLNETFGIQLTSATLRRNDQLVSSVFVTVDWSRLTGLFGQGVVSRRISGSGGAALLGRVIGARPGIAISGHGKRFAIVVGPDPVERARLLASKRATGPAMSGDPWAKAAVGAASFVRVEPRGLGRILAAAGEGEPAFATITEPLVLTAVADGARMHLDISAPSAFLEELFAPRVELPPGRPEAPTYPSAGGRSSSAF